LVVALTSCLSSSIQRSGHDSITQLYGLPKPSNYVLPILQSLQFPTSTQDGKIEMVQSSSNMQEHRTTVFVHASRSVAFPDS
jgi:hypothetical protein